MTAVRNKQQTDFYHQETIQLARSLVLKSFSTAVAMNDQVDQFYLLHGIDKRVSKNDHHSWRYYCHLAGEYHEYDLMMLRKPLEIRSLDTLQMIELTKENMETHRATLEHYRNKGEYYVELVNRYPDYHILIDGICNPLDKDTCIKAKDYAILSYNPKYVESNEHYLMDDLSKMIHDTVNRFHSRNYHVFQEGYDAMKLAMLAMQLPGMIIAIREQYVGTMYVHSYHLWSYLASWFNLDRFRPWLTQDQALWLYREVRYLDANGGKQSNMQELILKLLTERGIPIHGFKMMSDIDYIDIQREKLNFIDKKDQFLDDDEIHHIFNKERDLAIRNKDFEPHALGGLPDMLDREVTSNFPIKLLESKMYDYSSNEPFPFSTRATYYWYYMAYTNRYPLMVPLVNQITNETFTIDAKEGFLLWFYICSRFMTPFHNRDIDNAIIPSFKAANILREQVDWKRMRRKLIDEKIGIDDALSAMMKDYPTYETIYSREGFIRFVTEIHTYANRLKDIEASYHDLTLWGEVNHVTEYLWRHHTFNLTPTPMTFNEYFKLKGWSFHDLEEEKLLEVGIYLYRQFVGTFTEGRERLSDIQRAMLAIMQQLSSYSIQFAHQVSGQDVRYIEYPEIRYGHKSTYVSNLSHLFRQLTNVTESRGQERSHLDISQHSELKDDDVIRSQERAHHSAIIPPVYKQRGRTTGYHEVLSAVLHVHPGEGSTPYRPRPQPTYTINRDTLYLWDTPSVAFRPWLDAKLGLPVDHQRR